MPVGSRFHILNDIQNKINPNSNQKFELTRSFDILRYVVTLTVDHSNAAALNVTPFEFLTNVVQSFRFQPGAGNDKISLDGGQLLQRMLSDDRGLIYTLDKTSGDNKKSVFTLYINIYNPIGVNPKDTRYHTLEHEHLNILMSIGDLTAVSNATLNHVDVNIREHQKSGVKPLTVGNTPAKMQFRRPILVTGSFNADNNRLVIDLPKRSIIHRAIIYVQDGDKIMTNSIQTVELKVKQEKRAKEYFDILNQMNRHDMLKVTDNTDFNGVGILDFASGESTQAIDTSLASENQGELIFDVKHNGMTQPKVVVIFETVESA